MQSVYNGNHTVSCVGYSLSGRTVFVGVNEKGCLALDMKGNKRYEFHNTEVICLGVSKFGKLYTGCSDHLGRVMVCFEGG